MTPNTFVALVKNRLEKQDTWFCEAGPIEKKSKKKKAATRGVLWKKVFLEISQNS